MGDIYTVQMIVCVLEQVENIVGKKIKPLDTTICYSLRCLYNRFAYSDRSDHKQILNPLPDDNILDWSKLKQIADDILKRI